MSAPQKTPISVLNELAIKLKLDISGQYIDIPPKPSEPVRTSPIFIYEYVWENRVARGEGTAKKRAQHNAAENMLEILKQLPDFSYAFPADNIQLTSPSEIAVEKDAVGPLMEYVNVYMIPTPTFVNVREEGPAHDRRFTSRCSIPCYAVEAFDRQKKQAKQQVALQMLTMLKNTIEPHVDRIIKTDLPEAYVHEFQEALKKFANCERTFNTKYHPKDLTHPIVDAFTRYQDYHEVVGALDESGHSETENPEEMLDSILTTIGINYSLVPITAESDEDCIVVLNIQFAPDLSICEMGTSYDEASRRAAVKAIHAIKLLCSPPKKNLESQPEEVEVGVSEELSVENLNLN